VIRSGLVKEFLIAQHALGLWIMCLTRGGLDLYK
jgi:hypothetical protein